MYSECGFTVNVGMHVSECVGGVHMCVGGVWVYSECGFTWYHVHVAI